jgi:hypothetical protein
LLLFRAYNELEKLLLKKRCHYVYNKFAEALQFLLIIVAGGREGCAEGVGGRSMRDNLRRGVIEE